VVRSASASGGFGAALGGGLGAAPQVSILAQDCILRREALAKLDAGLGAIGHWRDPAADPPLRLAPDASMVDALARRRGAVTVGHTRADSLIRVEASGPDPAIAQAISTALIGCAEEVVDGLSAHMRSNRPAAPSGRPTRRRRAAHQDAARLQKGLRVFLAETGAGGEALRASLAGPLSHAPEGCSQVKNPCRAAAFRAAWIETRWRRIADEGLGARDTRHASPRRPSPTLADVQARMERARRNRRQAGDAHARAIGAGGRPP